MWRTYFFTSRSFRLIWRMVAYQSLWTKSATIRQRPIDKISVTPSRNEGWGLMPAHAILKAAPSKLQLMWNRPAFKPAKAARATVIASSAVDAPDKILVISGMVFKSGTKPLKPISCRADAWIIFGLNDCNKCLIISEIWLSDRKSVEPTNMQHNHDINCFRISNKHRRARSNVNSTRLRSYIGIRLDRQMH